MDVLVRQLENLPAFQPFEVRVTIRTEEDAKMFWDCMKEAKLWAVWSEVDRELKNQSIIP